MMWRKVTFLGFTIDRKITMGPAHRRDLNQGYQGSHVPLQETSWHLNGDISSDSVPRTVPQSSELQASALGSLPERSRIRNTSFAFAS